MNTTTLDRPTVELTLADRCDASALGSCAAEVAVWLTEANEPLLFCHHHFHVNKARIAELHPFYVQEGK
jgi:hypothetical protein